MNNFNIIQSEPFVSNNPLPKQTTTNNSTNDCQNQSNNQKILEIETRIHHLCGEVTKVKCAQAQLSHLLNVFELLYAETTPEEVRNSLLLRPAKGMSGLKWSFVLGMLFFKLFADEVYRQQYSVTEQFLMENFLFLYNRMNKEDDLSIEIRKLIYNSYIWSPYMLTQGVTSKLIFLFDELLKPENVSNQFDYETLRVKFAMWQLEGGVMKWHNSIWNRLVSHYQGVAIPLVRYEATSQESELPNQKLLEQLKGRENFAISDFIGFQIDVLNPVQVKTFFKLVGNGNIELKTLDDKLKFAALIIECFRSSREDAVIEVGLAKLLVKTIFDFTNNNSLALEANMLKTILRAKSTQALDPKEHIQMLLDIALCCNALKKELTRNSSRENIKNQEQYLLHLIKDLLQELLKNYHAEKALNDLVANTLLDFWKSLLIEKEWCSELFEPLYDILLGLIENGTREEQPTEEIKKTVEKAIQMVSFLLDDPLLKESETLLNLSVRLILLQEKHKVSINSKILQEYILKNIDQNPSIASLQNVVDILTLNVVLPQLVTKILSKIGQEEIRSFPEPLKLVQLLEHAKGSDIQDSQQFLIYSHALDWASESPTLQAEEKIMIQKVMTRVLDHLTTKEDLSESDVLILHNCHDLIKRVSKKPIQEIKKPLDLLSKKAINKKQNSALYDKLRSHYPEPKTKETERTQIQQIEDCLNNKQISEAQKLISKWFQDWEKALENQSSFRGITQELTKSIFAWIGQLYFLSLELKSSDDEQKKTEELFNKTLSLWEKKIPLRAIFDKNISSKLAKSLESLPWLFNSRLYRAIVIKILNNNDLEMMKKLLDYIHLSNKLTIDEKIKIFLTMGYSKNASRAMVSIALQHVILVTTPENLKKLAQSPEFISRIFADCLRALNFKDYYALAWMRALITPSLADGLIECYNENTGSNKKEYVIKATLNLIQVVTQLLQAELDLETLKKLILGKNCFYILFFEIFGAKQPPPQAAMIAFNSMRTMVKAVMRKAGEVERSEIKKLYYEFVLYLTEMTDRAIMRYSIPFTMSYIKVNKELLKISNEKTVKWAEEHNLGIDEYSQEQYDSRVEKKILSIIGSLEEHIDLLSEHLLFLDEVYSFAQRHQLKNSNFDPLEAIYHAFTDLEYLDRVSTKEESKEIDVDNANYIDTNFTKIFSHYFPLMSPTVGAKINLRMMRGSSASPSTPIVHFSNLEYFNKMVGWHFECWEEEAIQKYPSEEFRKVEDLFVSELSLVPKMNSVAVSNLRKKFDDFIRKFNIQPEKNLTAQAGGSTSELSLPDFNSLEKWSLQLRKNLIGKLQPSQVSILKNVILINSDKNTLSCFNLTTGKEEKKIVNLVPNSEQVRSLVANEEWVIYTTKNHCGVLETKFPDCVLPQTAFKGIPTAFYLQNGFSLLCGDAQGTIHRAEFIATDIKLGQTYATNLTSEICFLNLVGTRICAVTLKGDVTILDVRSKEILFQRLGEGTIFHCAMMVNSFLVISVTKIDEKGGLQTQPLIEIINCKDFSSSSHLQQHPVTAMAANKTLLYFGDTQGVINIKQWDQGTLIPIHTFQEKSAIVALAVNDKKIVNLEENSTLNVYTPQDLTNNLQKV